LSYDDERERPSWREIDKMRDRSPHTRRRDRSETQIEKALKSIGCPHESVEMTISLLGLVVLGELHLSNRGLVELKNGKPPRFVNLYD